MAGVVGAPEAALDNLADAAAGRSITHESFLPLTYEDFALYREVQERLQSAKDVWLEVEALKERLEAWRLTGKAETLEEGMNRLKELGEI